MTNLKRAGILLLILILGACGYRAFRSWRARNWRATYERALALQREGRCREAADIFLSARRLCPSGAGKAESLYLACIGLDAAGERERALALWRELASDPEAGAYRPRALLELARAEAAAGRTAAARERIEGLIRSSPEDALLGDAHLILAELAARDGDTENALSEARRVIEEYPGSESVAKAQEMAGDLSMDLLFSRKITPGTAEYVVERGDSLQSIAKRFGTTVELLRAMNGDTARGDSIRPGDRLKVCTERFSIIVDKSASTLTLKAGERFMKTYRVGTGKGGSTPEGEFTIVNRIEKPEWFKPGGGVVPYREPEDPGDIPENLLGTRWMGFDRPGYGIHGTWEPETVGKQASAGCIRLLNEDVEELYTVAPVGTRVTVVE